MKLSKLERKILCFIEDEYPVAWNQSETDKIIAVGERPIPTREKTVIELNEASESEIIQALNRLESYQFIIKVYLHAEGDFSVFQTSPGNFIRCPISKLGSGIYAYQITTFGKEIVSSFMLNQLKKWFYSQLNKISEDYLRLILAFVLGILLSSLFGLDIRNVGETTKPTPAESKKEQQAASEKIRAARENPR